MTKHLKARFVVAGATLVIGSTLLGAFEIGSRLLAIPSAHAADGSGLGQFYNFPPDVIGKICLVPDIYSGKLVQPTDKLLNQNATLTADARGRVSNAYCKDERVTIVVDWEDNGKLIVGSVVPEADVVVDN